MEIFVKSQVGIFFFQMKNVLIPLHIFGMDHLLMIKILKTIYKSHQSQIQCQMVSNSVLKETATNINSLTIQSVPQNIVLFILANTALSDT